MTNITANMYDVTDVEGDKRKDTWDFTPPAEFQTPVRARNKELSRTRLSLAGFDVSMQAQRAEFRQHIEQSNMDANPRPAKRHQSLSKSFSTTQSGHLDGIRASYQAAKANAKKRIKDVAHVKRRAASHGTHETPVLQRTRSLFGLRPVTSARNAQSHSGDIAPPADPLPLQDPLTQVFAWSQIEGPGAAARQSARDFGKTPANRCRDDSAFGEHRRRSAQHRESGVSLAAELEGLQLGDATRVESVPDIARQDPCKVLPMELSQSIFSFLDVQELLKCERVSKNWQRLSQDSSLRRREFMRKWAPKPSGIPSLPAVGGEGIGKPSQMQQNWTCMFKARQEMERRWREGPNCAQATATYLNGHTDSVYCVQFDERKIITGSRDRTFRVWDVESGELYLTVGVPGAAEIDKRHGHRISAQEAISGPMHVVNHAASPDASYITPSFYHDASILCLQFDDELLVTGSSDHSLIMWDMKTYQPIRRLSQHTAGVLDIAFDKQKIISCSKDGTICVWDRVTGKLLTVLTGHRGPVNAVQMRGNLIVTASGEGCAKLWQLDDRYLGTMDAEIEGRCLKEFRSKDRGLACVEFSSDGRFVMAGGNDKVIYKFDARTGALIEVYKGHRGLVRSLYLDQQNGRIVTGSYDNELKCWDYIDDNGGSSTGSERWGLSRWATSWILSAKSDYRRLVTTSQDGRALLLDFGTDIPGASLLEG